MATDKTKAEKEYTVEEKLKTLYDLQTILSEIDRIKTLRGELPLEVQDLEDEIAGLETRIKNFHTEIEDLKAAVSAKKVEIQNAQTLIEKYTKQQDNVRNNREFDFLSKEIEYQTLEIQLCEKRINEFIARSVLFGMPPLFPTAIAMCFELMTYGFVAGFLYNRSRWQCVIALYRSMIASMVAGRLVWGVAQIVLLGLSGSAFTLQAFMAGALLNAIPGIVLQLLLIPAIMVALNRTGFVPFKQTKAVFETNN